MKKVATFTMTTSYQSLSTLMDAFSGNPLKGTKVLKNGAFRAALASTDDIRISIAETASDNASILLDQGEYLSFDEVNLTQVWAKAVATGGTLELEGEADW